MSEILMIFMTYFAVPLTAWCLYLRLYRSMEARAIFEPPDVQFFLIFTVYAGWVMVFFILLAGAWTDLMYLVLVYLLMVAPILMLFVIVSILPSYRNSLYHTWALVASVVYVGFYVLVICMSVLALIARI
jgi:hypothetical protein